jgi:predicted MPP superfamily phosphohydrolase
MKHIVIGDIHGRDTWQTINFNQYDKVVFLGDYVDSFTISDEAILKNFEAVVEFREREPAKVVLLLGNHDVQYLHYPHQRCSGFRESMQKGLTYLFNRDKKLFSLAYQFKNYLFTHAGVSTVWYRDLMRLPIAAALNETSDNLADLLNKLEETSARYMLYSAGYHRGGTGNGGILWADRQETIRDSLDGYHQIVGHTSMEEVTRNAYPGTSITYIDVLQHQSYFHEIDI